jgi:hypothetical protein
MKNTKPNQTLILVVSILLSLGIGFYAGTKYQSEKKPDFVNEFSRQGRGDRENMPTNGMRQPGGTQGMPNRGIMRPVTGEIINADAKSITVKGNDGSNKIVLVSTTTDINKAQKATLSDLKIGEKVSVFGTSNSDGSVTAQNIQLNPIIPNISVTITPAK